MTVPDAPSFGRLLDCGLGDESIMDILRLAMAASIVPLLATDFTVTGRTPDDPSASTRMMRDAACDGTHLPRPGTERLRLHLVNGDALPARERSEMMRETTRRWRASGISVQWSDDPDTRSAEQAPGVAETMATTELYVTVDPSLPEPRPFAERRPLAYILFTGGAPTTRVTVFPRAAEALLEGARVDDVALTERPWAMREHLLGLMLGRAVAHELGHYLFGSPGHALTGLMRANFRSDQLMSSVERPFRVEPPPAPACMTLARAPVTGEE